MGPSIGDSKCAYLFYMGLSFCWYSIYSEDEWKSFLVSTHCGSDNAIVSPHMLHSIQKIVGSRTVSKVSAADTAQDGSWWVPDRERKGKGKGCFTRRMVLPSRGKRPACRGVCWGEFHCSQCGASPGRGLHHAGESLGFRQHACSWKWEALSRYLLVLLLPECYSWPTSI